ncbi:uncharacterized protein MKZ38_009994 [Zalerion maritima]|uniref:C2H2-type domain-containing protein n=1 Tax=Zalerion maritima TaxID=339359 RepID=A0AAD5WSR7_9PEZI|nr:uncharacterized protein MKZ38_009994 [Zalerion maritima]
MANLQHQLHQHHPTPGSLNLEHVTSFPHSIPLQAFSMEQLDSMDLATFNLDDSFSTMSCPGSATFSASSSVYDSYTSISGRSTPQGSRQNSFEFDICTSSALPYEFTPPSTASTGCFPLEQGHRHEGNIPATPARKHMGLNASSDTGLLELAMGSHHNQHQHLDICGFNSPMHTISFEQPTTTPPHQPGARRDATSIWNVNVDSPILFNKNPSSNGSPAKSFKLESPISSNMHALSSPARRKLYMDEAQQKASVLQNYISPSRRSIKQQHAQSEYSNYQSYSDRRITAPLSTIPRAGWKCTFPGCESNFKRQEHLKRHIRTIHVEQPQEEMDSCVFCPKTFKNRPDNYRQHLTLHADPKRSGETGYRVPYHPDAAAELRREQEKTRNRNKRHKSKAQSRSRQETARGRAHATISS